MNLYDRNVIKLLEEKYEFRTKKALGQNFLTDKKVIDNIIEGSNIDKKTLAIEIGPGFGVITNELCKKALKVIAIELDKNLIPILGDILSEYDNYEILNYDVLKVDLNKVIDEEKLKNPDIERVAILGNLPYYITTPIIMKVLEEDVKADSITCMMQKEVADRINAKNNSKDYGALTIAVQYYSDVNRICEVSKESFLPRPEVDSTVLRLDIREKERISVNDKKLFFKVVKAGFSQRRKTLSNSLKTLGFLNNDKIKEALNMSGIDPIRRAETLSIEEFAILTNNIEKIK